MNKKCKNCNKEIIITNPQTRNIKFCSVVCRSKYEYRTYRKKWQEDRRNAIADKPDKGKIKCLICGRYYRQLLTHAYLIHKMKGRDYKKKFGYDVKRGLILEDYRQIKRETQDPETLKNLKKGKKYWFKKGSLTAGRYERSEQTKARLIKQGKYVLPHNKKVTK